MSHQFIMVYVCVNVRLCLVVFSVLMLTLPELETMGIKMFWYLTRSCEVFYINLMRLSVDVFLPLFLSMSQIEA